MDWSIVEDWLMRKKYINYTWDRIDVTEEGFYCEDKFENTFISLFSKGQNQLVCFLGCLSPKIYVGGDTCYHDYDAIYYLENNFEYLSERLNEKIEKEMRRYNGSAWRI